MENKIITYISIFGFILVLISQGMIIMKRLEERRQPGDPLMEAINSHLASEKSITGTISRATGFGNMSRFGSGNNEAPIIDGSLEGYRPYIAPKRAVVAPTPVDPYAPLPSLDGDGNNNSGYSSPSGSNTPIPPSYYPRAGN